jgi:hypothetical protein
MLGETYGVLAPDGEDVSIVRAELDYETLCSTSSD